MDMDMDMDIECDGVHRCCIDRGAHYIALLVTHLMVPGQPGGGRPGS